MANILKLCLLWICWISVESANETNLQQGRSLTRIIGGQVSNIKREKYLVQVLTASKLCGGSLVQARWVITAAHCVYGTNISQFRIYGGASNLAGPNAIVRSVDFAAIHPKFNYESLNMDVAALRLNKDMSGANIATIQLATQAVPARAVAKVSGWGLLKADAKDTPKRVHTVKVPVWQREACVSSYSGIKAITRSMLCAAKPNKRDSCNGDSGGPLVYKGKLSGIVSWGYSCGTNLPGVYTNVLVIRKWFLRVVAKNSK